MSRENLLQAVKIVGGQSALAIALRGFMPRTCKITQANISQWLNPKKIKCEVPPPEYVIPIARSTKWRMTPHQLRPDLYPHPSDGLPKCEQIQQ